MHSNPQYPHRTLVLGGISSGKSVWAEQFASLSRKNKIYLATSEPVDDELKAKIARHRSRRGPDWQLIESPLTNGSELLGLDAQCVVLLECLSTWLGNIMHSRSTLADILPVFYENLEQTKAHVILVSAETGLGLLPANKAGRDFCQKLGVINQELATRSNMVVLVSAGLPVFLKGRYPNW